MLILNKGQDRGREKSGDGAIVSLVAIETWLCQERSPEAMNVTNILRLDREEGGGDETKSGPRRPGSDPR